MYMHLIGDQLEWLVFCMHACMHDDGDDDDDDELFLWYG